MRKWLLAWAATELTLARTIVGDSSGYAAEHEAIRVVPTVLTWVAGKERDAR